MFTRQPYHPDKYARVEAERRFLLEAAPPGLDLASGYLRIVDRYLPGTRLRLRRIETPQGEPVALKFGQKYRAPDQGPQQALMTNLYLNQAEYELLARLEGRLLVKRRYDYLYESVNYSVDVFEGNLDGLVLAELEAQASAAFASLSVPAFAVREVTADPLFSGGALAGLSPGEFKQLREARS